MTSVDRYIFWQVSKPLIVAMAVALCVLLIERMLQLIDLVLGANGTLRVVLEILAYLLPQYLSLALPISLMIGVMFAFGRLSRDGETGALQAAGIGLARQTRPVILVAALVAVVSSGVLGYMKPYGRYAYEALVFVVTDAAIQAFVRTGVFSRLGDTTFLVEGLSDDGSRFERVFVFQQESNDGSDVIAARNGSLMRSDANAPPTLHLFDGVRLTIEVDETALTEQSTVNIDVLQFAELRTRLGSGMAQAFRARGKDEREMTMHELWIQRNNPPPGVETADLIAELHGRIARVLSIFVLPFLGIAFAIRTGRSDRTHGLVICIVTIFLFNQLLDLGENATEAEQVSVYVGIWAPFLLFCVISFGVFYFKAREIPERVRWRWKGLGVRRAGNGARVGGAGS